MNSRITNVLLPLLAVGLIVIAFYISKSDAVQPSRLATSPTTSSPTPRLIDQKNISGIVVPHHDLVKQQRADLFANLGKTIATPKTVILISPNHYENGKADIQTTSQTWDITSGTIQPDRSVIKNIVDQQVASEETESFSNEHGIRLILADIKNTFPAAEIVPIIFKMNTSKSEILSLHNSLTQNCANCLVIASVDFSHYQPALLAQLHDNLTKRALQNLDTDKLLKDAEVDSPPALAFLTEWARSHATERFNLIDQTNSGVIAKNPDIETTTHFFGWYESGEKAKPANGVSFTLGGDMMFGRMIAHTFLKGGLSKSLEKLGDRVFWGTDAGIVNLEGPVSDVPVPDDTRSDNLVFNFPPETISALRYLKVNAASQANNHSANAGTKGLATTRSLLGKANIQAFGGPGDDGIDKIASFEGQNLTLKVIGVHTLASIPDLAPLIKKLKEDPKNRVMIFPHWGAEYIYKHGSSQTQQAHSWIDAGADLVIGAHPHVIQDSELYNGKPVIYSVGNLLFDQTFSLETQQGLLISGEFSDEGLRLFALPIQATKLQPAIIRSSTKNSILDKLYSPFAAQLQKTEYGNILFFPIK